MDSHDPNDGAFREGDPPYRFDTKRRLERPTWVHPLAVVFRILSLAGFAWSVGVLCFSLERHLNAAVPLFTLGLLLQSIGSVALILLRHYKFGVAGLVFVLILLACSFVPCYGEHVGEPAEPRSHRHVLWDLGHIH